MKKFKNYICLGMLTGLLCFTLTGCGNNTTTGSTSGNNDNNVVDEAADDVGDAAKDVANDIGNAVDDLVGNGGFDNYNDAHDYFMDTMGSYHADAKFELRDEDQELNDYQEGSKGYRFNLYDTSSNTDGELFGEFYVDATSGAIYRKGDDGKVTEYPGSKGNGSASNGRTNNPTTSSNTTTGGTGNQASRNGASSANGATITR